MVYNVYNGKSEVRNPPYVGDVAVVVLEGGRALQRALQLCCSEEPL